uniref:Uncharacterized protein n=1 Tax=Ciona savignyi TaxID=51511 RepID=H2Y4Z0_CIOSA
SFKQLKSPIPPNQSTHIFLEKGFKNGVTFLINPYENLRVSNPFSNFYPTFWGSSKPSKEQWR